MLMNYLAIVTRMSTYVRPRGEANTGPGHDELVTRPE